MSFGKGKDEKDQIPSLTAVPSYSYQGGTFQGSASQPRSDNSSRDAFLGKGTRVVGTLTFSGPVEIDGEVEGEIVAQERITIGESAKIKGKISGTEIVVKGEVHGDIFASRRLSLRKPARVRGNISAALLSVEEGVSFEGKCTMDASLSVLEGRDNRGPALVAV